MTTKASTPSAGFDLSAAVKERADSVQPYEVRVGAKAFPMSPLIDVEAITDSRTGILGILERQMGGDVFADFKATCTDEGLVLDALVLNQLGGAYFDHLGIPNPFNPDGTIKPEILKQLGE